MVQPPHLVKLNTALEKLGSRQLKFDSMQNAITPKQKKFAFQFEDGSNWRFWPSLEKSFLSAGSYGSVYMVTPKEKEEEGGGGGEGKEGGENNNKEKKKNKIYAVKVMKKSYFAYSKKEIERLCAELVVLKNAKHPNLNSMAEEDEEYHIGEQKERGKEVNEEDQKKAQEEYDKKTKTRLFNLYDTKSQFDPGNTYLYVVLEFVTAPKPCPLTRIAHYLSLNQPSTSSSSSSGSVETLSNLDEIYKKWKQEALGGEAELAEKEREAAEETAKFQRFLDEKLKEKEIPTSGSLLGLGEAYGPYRAPDVDLLRCIIFQACDGLNFLHNVHVICHRDVKSENMLVAIPRTCVVERVCDSSQEKEGKKKGKIKKVTFYEKVNVKLIDFYYARFCSLYESKTSSFPSTPGSTASSPCTPTTSTSCHQHQNQHQNHHHGTRIPAIKSEQPQHTSMSFPTTTGNSTSSGSPSSSMSPTGDSSSSLSNDPSSPSTFSPQTMTKCWDEREADFEKRAAQEEEEKVRLASSSSSPSDPVSSPFQQQQQDQHQSCKISETVTKEPQRAFMMQSSSTGDLLGSGSGGLGGGNSTTTTATNPTAEVSGAGDLAGTEAFSPAEILKKRTKTTNFSLFKFDSFGLGIILWYLAHKEKREEEDEETEEEAEEKKNCTSQKKKKKKKRLSPFLTEEFLTNFLTWTPVERRSCILKQIEKSDEILAPDLESMEDPRLARVCQRLLEKDVEKRCTCNQLLKLEQDGLFKDLNAETNILVTEYEFSSTSSSSSPKKTCKFITAKDLPEEPRKFFNSQSLLETNFFTVNKKHDDEEDGDDENDEDEERKETKEKNNNNKHQDSSSDDDDYYHRQRHHHLRHRQQQPLLSCSDDNNVEENEENNNKPKAKKKAKRPFGMGGKKSKIQAGGMIDHNFEVSSILRKLHD